MTVPISSGLEPIPRKRKSHRRLGTINVTLLSILYLLSWVAAEWSWFQRERRATAILERNYGAWVHADVFVRGPAMELRELWRGRLYLPVRWVTVHDAAVDDGMSEELRCFRYLESLTFSDCRGRVCLPVDALSRLDSLTFSNTTLTIDDVCRISRLRRLESLTLRGVGLKGDWLEPLSALANLNSLELYNVDLTEVATDSLARMKGLIVLQLSNVKVNSELWPALAELGELEGLVIKGTPFDDEGMRHLVRLRKLRALYLVDTTISDAGMASLAQLPNLCRLSLDGNNVGDAGLRHLLQLPRLQALDISRTRATNACLRGLASMPTLKIVLVEGTSISPSAPGFVGICNADGSVWYPNEARRKEIEEYSEPDGDSGDEGETAR
ncbi:MAG TPA: hypothetical protein PL064_01675 [Thermogutta sp.]|nr:hypothetical protein [Thermogutta sp.]